MSVKGVGCGKQVWLCACHVVEDPKFNPSHEIDKKTEDQKIKWVARVTQLVSG